MKSLLLVSSLSTTAEAVATQISEVPLFFLRAECCEKIVCCFKEDTHSWDNSSYSTEKQRVLKNTEIN